MLQIEKKKQVWFYESVSTDCEIKGTVYKTVAKMETVYKFVSVVYELTVQITKSCIAL